jgi:hypothetical protein
MSTRSYDDAEHTYGHAAAVTVGGHVLSDLGRLEDD